MKKIIYLLAISLILISCHKDEENIETLPEATQTGAGIFACKVDGKSFIDESGGYFNCFYQLIDGEYYFGIQGLDIINDITSINFGTEKKEITEGDTLNLLAQLVNSV